jgi:hypothetical protein
MARTPLLTKFQILFQDVAEAEASGRPVKILSPVARKPSQKVTPQCHRVNTMINLLMKALSLPQISRNAISKIKSRARGGSNSRPSA